MRFYSDFPPWCRVSLHSCESVTGIKLLREIIHSSNSQQPKQELITARAIKHQQSQKGDKSEEPARIATLPSWTYHSVQIC
jgi:hypothetical protein